MITDFGSASIKMIGSLVFILALILCLFFLVKRLRLSSLSLDNYPEMRLIGRLTLAPKRAIALVEICDQWLIVGIGTENVTLISKLDSRPDPINSDAVTLINRKIGLWQRIEKRVNKVKNAES